MPELGRGCPSLLAEARLSLGLFVPPLIECNSGSKCRGFFWYGNWTVPGWFWGTHYYIYLGGGRRE
jgi:hypothetical protein